MGAGHLHRIGRIQHMVAWRFVPAAVVLIVMIALSGWTGAGFSQVPEFCSAPLGYAADPSEIQRFRQQCTIQKLIAERADEANKATATEVEQAVTAARLKAQTEALEEANRRAEYWEHYAAGLEFQPKLSSALNEACSWHGVQNEPTARMCKLWRSR